MKLLTKNSEEDDEYTLVQKVESPESAVELFHAFYQRDTFSFLKFDRTDNDFVELVIGRKKEVWIYCVSGNSAFETQISQIPGRRPFSPEDFVRHFCEDTHKEHYNFEEKEEEERAVENPQLTSHSKFGFGVLWPFLTIAGGSLLLVLVKRTPSDLWSLVGFMIGVAFVFTLPYHILVWHYFRFNGNSTLAVSRKENMLTITRGGNASSIRLDGITKVRLVFGSGRLSSQFSHLIIEAGPQDRAVITHFLYEDLQGLAKFLKVKPRESSSIYPLIWLKRKSEENVAEETEERQVKTDEFISKWSAKKTEELKAIVNSKDEYAEHAVEAAKRLLKQRGK